MKLYNEHEVLTFQVTEFNTYLSPPYLTKLHTEPAVEFSCKGKEHFRYFYTCFILVSLHKMSSRSVGYITLGSIA